ncbi:sigma 54-interacting transcriptional regulator [Enterococcus hulanensis]|uniref:sigma 54-interacting transcriptional regulator n=1 Tax=Enterococcus hulanensis TaxID=2559929 RepID=UPI001A90254D|nr:sigma 54-interacting transcriptional regulator [Enterococcus hulanensis]MBO0458220.1 sigma 54-interacting transcriptional regulator [Enterococcus hulanensis]
MKRINLVHKQLVETSRRQLALYGIEIKGSTSTDIANKLGLDRANVSKDLNRLVTEQKAVKINKRPVLFIDKQTLEDNYHFSIEDSLFSSMEQLQKLLIKEKRRHDAGFFDLVGETGSLKEAVKKAQAAIFYPVNGLTTLITGETGVGKSLFAEKMYLYALNEEKVPENAPFITFNCADFADNQHLLLSHLFGHKKGAFTGATEDSKGLVEAANNGFLFLDEVHRLSAKGQEMLFYLMDKGIYRKLGDVENDYVTNVRLIMATTERPSEVMLNTFLRRIPVHIHLPPLYERSWEEKMAFLSRFAGEESQRISRDIRINQGVLSLLLNYQFEGNIGQLKSDFQFSCANAFIETIKEGSSEVSIEIRHLPINIAQHLDGIENQRSLSHHLPESMLFKKEKSTQPFAFERNEQEDYQWIKENFLLVNKASISAVHEDQSKEVISEYTGKIIKKVNQKTISKDAVVKNMFIDNNILEAVKQALASFVDKESLDNYSKIIAYHLTIVLKNTSTSFEKKDIENLLNEPGEISMATKQIVYQTKNLLGLSLTELDIKIVDRLLNQLIQYTNRPHISILVVMHGENTASSIADTVNSLLSITSVMAIDMSLEEKVQDVYERTKQKVRELDNGLGVLIMADMGSIKSFEQKLKDDLGIHVSVMDMASTPLILEAAKLSLSRKLSLEELGQSLLSIMSRHWQSTQENFDPTDEFRYFETMMIHRMKKILVFLDSKKVFLLFKSVLERIATDLKIEITDEFLLKFIFHNGCMMEKILIDSTIQEVASADYQSVSHLVDMLEKHYSVVNEFFGIEVPKKEILNVADIFIYEFPEQLFLN